MKLQHNEPLIDLCNIAYLQTMHADNKAIPAWEVIARSLAEHGVVVMPVPLGTKLYRIMNTDAKDSCQSCFSYNGSAICDAGYKTQWTDVEGSKCPMHQLEIVCCRMTEDFWHTYYDQFGKTVFTTEEEARKAMERMQSTVKG